MPGSIHQNKRSLDVKLVSHPDLDIIVASDTSSYHIGACILHKMPNGSHKPVAHVWGTLFLQKRTTPKLQRSLVRDYFHSNEVSLVHSQ